MATRRKRQTKAAAKSRGLTAADVASAAAPPTPITALAEAITSDGGELLARFRDPLGGHWLLLAALPLDLVQPTPYQRDLSESHRKRLVAAIGKVGLFLDPILVTREAERSYWTPNGNHRLAAMRDLGAQAITALVVLDRSLAFKILALNTEKSHNLKEKALEVIRMARALAIDSDREEREFALEFEEPVLLTLGPCYEQHPRFSGSVWRAPLLRCEEFLAQRLATALKLRARRAEALLALDAQVAGLVEKLKQRGIQSPYLKSFVAARINPIRFKKETDLTPDELIAKMAAAAAKFDVAKVQPGQVSAAGGPPDEE